MRHIVGAAYAALMAATPTGAFWQVLQREVTRSGGEPLVTFYDDRSGERVELSYTTYANWVAKTASLLQDELDVERGATVVVDLPTHWLGPVWVGAAWALGATVTAATDPGSVDAADVVVCGPDTVQRRAEQAPGEVVACSLRPLGARFTTPPPAPVIDFGEVVWSQPDSLVVLDPPTSADIAWRDATGSLDQAQVLDLDGPGERALTTEPVTSRVGLATLVGPLRSGAGTVWVAGIAPGEPGRHRLEELARTERARLL